MLRLRPGNLTKVNDVWEYTTVYDVGEKVYKIYIKEIGGELVFDLSNVVKGNDLSSKDVEEIKLLISELEEHIYKTVD